MIYTHLAAAFIAGAVAFGSAWTVQGWRFGAAEKERIEAEAEKRRIDARAIDVAAVGHEADKTGIRTEFIVITEEVERVVKEPFYAGGSQCLDDAGLRQLTDAIQPADAASQPAAAVPRPRPAD